MEVQVEEPTKDPVECRPTVSEARKADGRRDAVAGM
jgi:hypothetical protein